MQELSIPSFYFFKTITFPNIFSSKILSIPVFCPVSKYKRLRIKLTL